MRDKTTQQRAKALRKRMTDAEQHLWGRLRRRQLLGFKFRRQVPTGPFIADFACVEAKLIVELDGGQHVDAQATDEARTQLLESRGFRVLRFWNDDVLKRTDDVLEDIVRALPDTPPS